MDLTNPLDENEVIMEAIKEYYKLKENYENLIMKQKKKIISDNSLSNIEKRQKFLELKPKCINCKQSGGTTFQIIYEKDTDEHDSYRIFIAKCNVRENPCKLNINFQIGKMEIIPELIKETEETIKSIKNRIITSKNKLLFGIIKSDQAIRAFDELKYGINAYSSFYESYYKIYNDIFNNDERKNELNSEMSNLYIQINLIKDKIKSMNETSNITYAEEAVDIYITTLIPLLNKIKNLKYKVNDVWFNEDTNTYHLIQNNYNISEMYLNNDSDNKVTQFIVGNEGIHPKLSKKQQPKIIIESDSDIEVDEGVNKEDIKLGFEIGDVEGDIEEIEDIKGNSSPPLDDTYNPFEKQKPSIKYLSDDVIYNIHNETKGLYNPDICFYFYSTSKDVFPGKGAREKLQKEFESEYIELSKIKDWRRKLSNFAEAPFELDGLRWYSVEHYYQASKFKKNNNAFYRTFSLDSGTVLSTDPNMAKAAGGKTGTYKKEKIRDKKIKPDPDFFDGEFPRVKKEMYMAQYAKFSQNKNMRELLLATKDASLIHILARSSESQVFYNLMYFRYLIKEKII